jgi:hypothetical protein
LPRCDRADFVRIPQQQIEQTVVAVINHGRPTAAMIRWAPGLVHLHFLCNVNELAAIISKEAIQCFVLTCSEAIHLAVLIEVKLHGTHSFSRIGNPYLCDLYKTIALVMKQ